jgi:hypothetical protein
MVDALVLGLHSMVVAEEERRYNCNKLEGLALRPRAIYLSIIRVRLDYGTSSYFKQEAFIVT